MYHHGNSYFWSAKRDEFARVAGEVHAENRRSGHAVKYIAEYLFYGLERRTRAIEILLLALSDGVLDESGQSQLVQYLHKQQRYGESIAVLEPMVKKRPENIQYRVWLMHAYCQTQRKDQLLALLTATDEYFHQAGRWGEAPMASLAASCLENKLFEQSAAYYEELIPLHQRTQPRRGIGNGTLSNYYRQMARAYSGLKNTPKAVEAAAGAIVSWGQDQDNRRSALQALTVVLRESPNLDNYVAHLDKESEQTGLHNPIVRKAIGMVYLEKREYARATEQLRLACEIQPNDTETHQKLIECYDKQDDREGAVSQLLWSLELARRDIRLYEDLGRRLSTLGKPEQAERAYTAIVEMLPAESESHTALAEIRQRQGHWDDAIVHWQQVARIRELEPTGLLKLAAAQIHQKQWDAADATTDKLRSRSWPSRFSNVESQTRELENQIERGRSK